MSRLECFAVIVGFRYRDKKCQNTLLYALEDGTFEEDIFLIEDNSNPEYPNAVAVYVGEHHVGYISEEDVINVREMIEYGIKICNVVDIGWEKNQKLPGYIKIQLLSV